MLKSEKTKMQIYYSKNKEKCKIRAKDYYQRNKEKIYKKQNEWRHKNKEKYNTYRRELQRRDKYKENRKKYYEKNRRKYIERTCEYFKTENGKELARKAQDKRRDYGSNKLYENIIDEPIEWHHIDDFNVVAIPDDIHYLYPLRPKELHRENIKPIIEQLYGWFPRC